MTLIIRFSDCRIKFDHGEIDASIRRGIYVAVTAASILLRISATFYPDRRADYLAFLKENKLELSMSRRGNCHDNAVAESFFSTFKKLVTQKKIYVTRNEARGEMLNFIEMFYNPMKRHSHTGGVSPAKFEADYYSRLEGV